MHEEEFPIFDLELPPAEPYSTHKCYPFFSKMIHRSNDTV
jgi:hypothetical protein